MKVVLILDVISTFAFAAQSTHVAEPSRFVALNGTECGFVYEPDEDLMLLSYGKGYRIEPSPDSHSALDVGSAFNQGRIVCNRPRNGTPPSSHMMCMNQRGNVTFYDLDAGTLGQEPGGEKIDVVEWDLVITGRDKPVFHFA